jgi:Mg2+/Co2+ transporter CorB
MNEMIQSNIEWGLLLEWDSIVSLLAILVLLLLSGFFSGSETALTAASRARMASLETEGNKRAGVVNRLLGDQERLIGAILLGNNVANISASAIATGLFLSVFGDAGVAVATAIMTALVLVFSEVLPKTYAILHSNTMAMAVAPLIRYLVIILSPFVTAVQALVRRTLRVFGAQIDASSHVFSVHEELRGAIQLHDESLDQTAPVADIGDDLSMVGGVLDLNDLEVGEVMVHRKNITMVDAGQPIPVIIDQVLGAPHTRIPLWRDNQENIIGVLHAKDLLRGPLGSYLKPPS